MNSAKTEFITDQCQGTAFHYENFRYSYNATSIYAIKLNLIVLIESPCITHIQHFRSWTSSMKKVEHQ